MTQYADAAMAVSSMAESVRRLEHRRLRVEAALEATEAVMSLRSCASGVEAAIRKEDFETACELVQKYKNIQGAGEAYETEAAAMRLATARVNQLVRERFFEACAARDDVKRWLDLLKRLDLVNDACEGSFLEYFRYRLKDAVGRALQCEDDKLSSVVNEVYKVVSELAGPCRRALGLSTAKSALLLAHDACEASALAVVARFASENRLASLAAQAKRNELESLPENAEDTLEDIARVLRHLETWKRFVAHIAKTLDIIDVSFDESRLSLACDEMAEWYAVLENRSLLSNLPSVDDVDGCFYVICESAMRAISTGCVKAADGALRDVNEALLTVLKALSSKALAALASKKGFILVALQEEEEDLTECQMAVNKVETAGNLLETLLEKLEAEIEENYGKKSRPNTAIFDRKMFSEALSRSLEALTNALLMRPLMANYLTPELPASVQYLLNPVDFDGVATAGPSVHRYSLDDSGFQALERSDDFAIKLASDQVRDAVERATGELSVENRTRVAGMFGSMISSSLTDYVTKLGTQVCQLTPIGAMQFEKDVRSIRSALSLVLDRKAIRDSLSDLHLMASVLCSQDTQDVLYYTTSLSNQQLLDIVKLKQWSDNERNKLQTILSQP